MFQVDTFDRLESTFSMETLQSRSVVQDLARQSESINFVVCGCQRVCDIEGNFYLIKSKYTLTIYCKRGGYHKLQRFR